MRYDARLARATWVRIPSRAFFLKVGDQRKCFRYSEIRLRDIYRVPHELDYIQKTTHPCYTEIRIWTPSVRSASVITAKRTC